MSWPRKACKRFNNQSMGELDMITQIELAAYRELYQRLRQVEKTHTPAASQLVATRGNWRAS